jgi:hypothetical protein
MIRLGHGECPWRSNSAEFRETYRGAILRGPTLCGGIEAKPIPRDFASRQAAKTQREPRRKRRVYTTGPNRQFNIKATSKTVERFYKMAEARNVSLCKWLEHALDALEREGPSAEMARRMHTSRAALDRLLDPVTLNTLRKAAHAVGRELRLELV